ncbi:MAG TPA: universal stress protein [Azospirillum sp.]|nr:universal stress protein [Azospirillum sp.]
MNKVLLPLTGRPLDRRAVAAAFLVAERFGGHVDGLCVMPHVEVRSTVESAALPAALVNQLIKIGQDDQAQVVDAARTLFEEACAKRGVRLTEGAPAPGSTRTASWQQATGPLAETIAEEARLADLVVIAQASDGTNAMGPVLEAALFGSGRPLLLAPLEEPATIGDAVAIAWDGGPAAARAVGAALPFLKQAGTISILTADSPDAGRAADPQRLVDYLAWQGVTAGARTVSPAGRALSAALQDTAREAGCDLMVMGAYGHSRVREMVLGGVTYDVLRRPPSLPILMAH